MGNLQTANVEINNDINLTSSTTWNGAISYATINDPLVELFFKSVRGMPCQDYRSIVVKQSKKEKERYQEYSGTSGKSIEEYFNNAWKLDPLRTLKFVFYLRDCRNGRGERQLFRALIRHMRECGKSEHIIANMEHIPTFGSWKDISICFFGTQLEEQAIELIASQLSKEKDNDHPSLCAKYAPTEGGAMDKSHQSSTKIANKLGVTLTQYRKVYLVPQRLRLNIVEREMCRRRWDGIQYEKVPAIAGSQYKSAFIRHDEQRYNEYLKSVQVGKKKMNVGVLMPYQIVSPYIVNGKISNRDETLEAQWSAFLSDRSSKWPSNTNILPLIDVSGSMFANSYPRPVDVAVSLGMTVSLLNSSLQYKGKFITFDSEPQLLSIQGESLIEQVNSITTTPWGSRTNFQSTFNLILNIAMLFKIAPDQMPQILLVLSDMQFDSTDNNNTNWNEIERKYTAAGYVRPMIIFWNLSGKSNDYPVPDASVPNCMLFSGFNDNIMYSLLDGKMPTPQTIAHKAIDHKRYDVIRLA
jgi:hypothetical protein